MKMKFTKRSGVDCQPELGKIYDIYTVIVIWYIVYIVFPIKKIATASTWRYLIQNITMVDFYCPFLAFTKNNTLQFYHASYDLK